MKFHKPLFSIILIAIQLVLSIKSHFEHVEMMEELKKTDLELSGLISFNLTYETLFYFVFIIGFCEMLTKPSWLKTLIRIFLVCIVLGTEFSGLIPIEDFKSEVYNTAWFAAGIALIIILIRIGKYCFEKITNSLPKKASR